MFTWICPQCGREVPPAYTECPDCAAKAAAPVTDTAAVTPPPPAPMVPPAPQQAPPQAYAPPPASVAPQTPPVVPSYLAQAPAPPRSGLPTWLLTVLFAFAFLGLGAGIYWTIGYLKGGSMGKPAASIESPAAKPGTAANPIQRYIEIAGVRFVGDTKKKDRTLTRFVVVNHSEADFQGLAGNVTVWGSTKRSEEDDEGTFAFKTDLKPFESREIEVPLTTKKKIYELPDWSNMTTDLQITEPAASAGTPAR